uniref:Coiled-coil domain containing 173 n=1 Tax=Rousettus aegyptiacus TaxID=9407 RepID=A0A7J8JD62_ROUAE|nr:coiled-coil domain containing 173 [Rousettus aegyptiacus]
MKRLGNLSKQKSVLHKWRKKKKLKHSGQWRNTEKE